MTDITGVIEANSSDLQKIKDHLENISASMANESELAKILSDATTEFNKFFLNYGKPYFTAHKFNKHDSPQSSVYNENLTTLDEDFRRLYTMVGSLSTLTIRSFNYATIVAKEIVNTAQISASKVLDLNIIGGFLKGQVFVAGDDFSTSDYVDTSVGLDTTQAEILKGGAAMALKRVGSVQVSNPSNKITITPVQPGGTETLDPTPGNLQRFYEGKFYAPIGEQEPEGGYLDIQYLVDTSAVPASGFTNTTDGKETTSGDPGSSAEDAYNAAQDIGFFAIMPPTESEKDVIRARMLDGNPDSYWQAEFVYQTPSLIPEGFTKGDITQDPQDNSEE
jgi:hypothetical protein